MSCAPAGKQVVCLRCAGLSMFHSNAAPAARAGALQAAAAVAACVAASISCAASAADGDAQTVVVTGTREPMPLSQIAADVW